MAHSREALLEMFWPDSPAHVARSSLTSALWLLRQDLASLGESAAAALHRDRQTVQLRTDLTTDVLKFEQLAAAATTRHGEERRKALSRAADLYQGELLYGLCDDWVLPEQRRLAAAYDRAVEGLCALLLSARELETALAYGRQFSR